MQRDAAAQPIGITVVGDDDQSIYSFRGAQPHVFQAFKVGEMLPSRSLLRRRTPASHAALLPPDRTAWASAPSSLSRATSGPPVRSSPPPKQ